MKHNRDRLMKQRWLGLLVGLLVSLRVYAYEVQVGNVILQPGGDVQVPVMLDDATDIAVVKFQINYDPQLLTLTGATNRPFTLGSVFALDIENDDGVVIGILYRKDSLGSGSGELASLQFTANSGAEVNMESVLTLADAGLADQNGKDPSWDYPLALTHGLVQIAYDPLADSDVDGIPDAWEALHFGNPTNANAYAICSNGINNLLEAYIAGVDPHDPQSLFLVSMQPGSTLEWSAISGRVYNVYWATNLMDGFQCLESNILWTSSPFTYPTDTPCGFYKIDVQLEP